MESDGLPASENTAPSSPTRSAIFSDELKPATTPPSSPPYFPWERQTEPDNIPKIYRKPVNNAFSILGKRKAFEPVSESTQNTKKQRKTPASASKPLTQMQISLGQEVQKRCKTCGMEYVSSSTEDRKLHDVYHKQNTQGYDVGKDFVLKTRSDRLYNGAVNGDWICAVDCSDHSARKRKGQAVLDIVQRELGAVGISESDIWEKTENNPAAAGQPRYTAYLYIRGTKCIAFLLVQKIKEALRVKEPVSTLDACTKFERDVDKEKKTETTSSLEALRARRQAAAELATKDSQRNPLSLSSAARPALLGIARVWTCSLYRKHSLATTLLDTAVKHHNDPAQQDGEGEQKSTLKLIGKGAVAFSQPTEAGRRLAERWFGKRWGWGVYID